MKKKITFKQYPLISKFISKIGVRKELRNIVLEISRENIESPETTNKLIQMEVMMIIIENAWKAEAEFNQILVFLTDKTPEEVEDLDVEEIINAFKNIEIGEGLAKSFI